MSNEQDIGLRIGIVGNGGLEADRCNWCYRDDSYYRKAKEQDDKIKDLIGALEGCMDTLVTIAQDTKTERAEREHKRAVDAVNKARCT